MVYWFEGSKRDRGLLMSGRLQGRVIPNVEGACVMKEGLNDFRGYMERSMFVRFQTLCI
jgi:hypothetical protein